MQRRRRELLVVAWVLTVLLLVVAVAGLLLVTGGVADRERTPAVHEPPAVGADVPAPRRPPARRAPPPVRIAIPASGVSAPIVPVGVDGAGALEVPEGFGDTRWWTGGARPGERGPAVIAGHVDSYTGPAVFRLGDLRRGDAITVERADGSHVRFRVQRSARYPAARFPTAAVFCPTRAPALRLVTCSATLDRARTMQAATPEVRSSP
jgi:hypothetical protein